MLTWALAWYAVHMKAEWETALPFIVAMGCDVAVVYYIAKIVTRSGA